MNNPVYQLAPSANVLVASPGKVIRKWIDVTKGSGVIMRIRLKYRTCQQIFAVVVLKFSCISKHALLRTRQRSWQRCHCLFAFLLNLRSHSTRLCLSRPFPGRVPKVHPDQVLGINEGVLSDTYVSSSLDKNGNFCAPDCFPSMSQTVNVCLFLPVWDIMEHFFWHSVVHYFKVA